MAKETPDVWSDDVSAPEWAVHGEGITDGEKASKAQRRSNFTLKGKNNSDSWLVIYFSDIEDGLELIDSPELDELMDKIAEKNEEFQSRFKGASTAPRSSSNSRSGGGWGNKTSSRSGGSQRRSEPVYDEAYDCDHGERDWVDKGTWQAWMCPSEDKDDKCDPLWANKDGSLQEKKSRSRR